jgi:high-affinity nickel-transport protein
LNNIAPTSGRTVNRSIALLGALTGINVLLWAVTLMEFHRFPLLLGTATLAYTFGLRHALDADHISAIDNVTRKLMQERQRPIGVGFFFSLGHSTIVFLLSVVIAFTAAQIQTRFPDLQRVGGLIGTSISATFLLVIAGINLFVLYDVAQAFRKVRRGEEYDDQSLSESLSQFGFMGRFFGPILRIVDKSWKMYFVGFLFGLGFDTATEVGLLGISATTATQGLPIWCLLLFPALFTAGMCLVDTADGILMLGAYGWAYVHPVRKLYYNLTITSVSVLVAVLVAGIETLGIIGERFALHGALWNAVGAMGDHFGVIGVLIVGVFIASWIGSTIIYRVMGYEALEARVPASLSAPSEK